MTLTLADQLADELIELLPEEERPLVWSLEAFCGGHAEQLAACRDLSNWIHLLCDRQSGKTWADLGILADNAQRHPESMNVFLGLVGTGVFLSVWPIWKNLCEAWGLCDSDAHNETRMLTTFPNGARVVFGGTDDLKNIRRYLGNRLKNCVFIVDESQDQATSMLIYLLRTLLPPMLTPTTRVILSGVLPDLPAGLFLKLAEYDAESGTGGQGPGFSHHTWGRASNVHTPEAMEQLRAFMKLHNIDENDPQIQRDWRKCRRVWDARLTAFRYNAHRNQWTGTPVSWLAGLSVAPGQTEPFPPGRLLAVQPPPGVDMFGIGLDPAATADRFAIVLWGWSRTKRMGLWQIAEWVTARGANALESQYIEVLKVLKVRYGNVQRVIRDAGSAATVNDTLWRNHGIMIEPAIKGPGSRKARVDRLADLLGTGQCWILAGSELENDLKLAKWDLKAREEGRYDWDSSHHPDVGDAGTYGAVTYYESVPEEKETPHIPEEQAMAADAAAAFKERFSAVNAPQRQRPRDSSMLWNQRGNRGGW